MLQRFLATISMLNLYGGRQQQSNDKQVPEKIILTDRASLITLDLVQKIMAKWIFPWSHIFWKVYPDSKQDIRKSWDLYTRCIVQVGMRLCKKKFRNKKECAILRLILKCFLS